MVGESLQWLQALVFRPSNSAKFEGKGETFLPWITFYETSIGSTVTNPTLRLKQLLDSVAPHIRRQLDHCALLPPEDGYNRAISLLWEDYGSPQVVCDSILAGIEKGGLIAEEDLKAQRHLSRGVSAACAVLDALSQRSNGQYDYMGPANTKQVIASVLGKLPYWSRSYARQYPGHLGLNFVNLKDFLEDRTAITTDPLLQATFERAKALGYKRSPDSDPKPP